MKKIIAIIAVIACFGITEVNAQDATPKDTSWKFTGLTSLNFTQVYLNNWAAGGEQSLALTSLANLNLNYKKGNKSWTNQLDLAYGLMQQGGDEVRKTDDRIDFLSKYGIQANDKWYYTFLFNFKSQFAPGYNYPDDSTKISEFMAPGYVLLSLGADYKPSDKFSAFVSPLTSKMTFVLNQDLADAGAFGVEAAKFNAEGVKTKDGENSLIEVGAYVNLLVNVDVMENVNLKSRLELFSSYTEDPTHIDVFWENILAMRVNKYITCNITTTLIYDHDIDIQETKKNGEPKTDDEGNPIIGPRTQFKEVLSLGLTYNFN